VESHVVEATGTLFTVCHYPSHVSGVVPYFVSNCVYTNDMCRNKCTFSISEHFSLTSCSESLL